MSVKLPSWIYLPEKAFYIYAIVAGPAWTKNLTVFVLWFLGISLTLINLAWRNESPEAFGKIVNTDEGWHIPIVKERSWIRHTLTIATIGTLAAMHWWWTATIYLIGCLNWWIFVDDVKTKVAELKEEVK